MKASMEQSLCKDYIPANYRRDQPTLLLIYNRASHSSTKVLQLATDRNIHVAGRLCNWSNVLQLCDRVCTRQLHGKLPHVAFLWMRQNQHPTIPRTAFGTLLWSAQKALMLETILKSSKKAGPWPLTQSSSPAPTRTEAILARCCWSCFPPDCFLCRTQTAHSLVATGPVSLCWTGSHFDGGDRGPSRSGTQVKKMKELRKKCKAEDHVLRMASAEPRAKRPKRSAPRRVFTPDPEEEEQKETNACLQVCPTIAHPPPSVPVLSASHMPNSLPTGSPSSVSLVPTSFPIPLFSFLTHTFPLLLCTPSRALIGSSHTTSDKESDRGWFARELRPSSSCCMKWYCYMIGPLTHLRNSLLRSLCSVREAAGMSARLVVYVIAFLHALHSVIPSHSDPMLNIVVACGGMCLDIPQFAAPTVTYLREPNSLLLQSSLHNILPACGLDTPSGVNRGASKYIGTQAKLTNATCGRYNHCVWVSPISDNDVEKRFIEMTSVSSKFTSSMNMLILCPSGEVRALPRHVDPFPTSGLFHPLLNHDCRLHLNRSGPRPQTAIRYGLADIRNVDWYRATFTSGMIVEVAYTSQEALHYMDAKEYQIYNSVLDLTLGCWHTICT
jgi:hypothetical protein